jgi:hypothetical protein
MALIRDRFSYEIPPAHIITEQHVFAAAEFELTRRELQYVLNEYAARPITPETIRPFVIFLAGRWERIEHTDLRYRLAENLPASLLCLQVATAIQKASSSRPSLDSLLMPTLTNPDVNATTKYGSPGWLRLVHELITWNEKEFTETIRTPQKVVGFLKALSDSDALNLMQFILEKEELEGIFDETDDEQVNNFWPFLPSEKKARLIGTFKDDELLKILNQQSTSRKEADFLAARQCFVTVLDDKKHEQENHFFLDEIDRAKKTISTAQLPLLTELVYRSALFLSMPVHIENNKRYPVIAAKVAKRTWGRVLGGSALMLFGATLIVASILCAVASAGASSLLSGLTAMAGKQVLIAGAVILGVAGAASVATASHILLTKPYLSITQAADRFFSSRGPASVSGEIKPGDSLSLNRRLST